MDIKIVTVNIKLIAHPAHRRVNFLKRARQSKMEKKAITFAYHCFTKVL